MTTMATIDRLVYHATILEFSGPSIRDQQGRGRRKGQTEPPEGPLGSTPSLAPGGAKHSVPPKVPSPQD